jgi:hypothetical protein
MSTVVTYRLKGIVLSLSFDWAKGTLPLSHSSKFLPGPGFTLLPSILHINCHSAVQVPPAACSFSLLRTAYNPSCVLAFFPDEEDNYNGSGGDEGGTRVTGWGGLGNGTRQIRSP